MARANSGDSVFQAIASPTRRALLDALALGESNVTDLVSRLNITQSAVSQQLAVLKSAGLVTERSAGRFRHYGLCAKPLREVAAWVGPYQALLERHLDDLSRVLDTLPDLGPSHVPPSKKRARSK